MEIVTGYVEHIVFRNEENGYTVFQLESEAGEVTCVGTLNFISEGERLEIKGDYVNHNIYGSQLKISSYEMKEPEDLISIERYLGSGAIKGVGAALAGRIVRKFKTDTFRIIEEEPERLAEVNGISERKAREIALQVDEKKGMRKVMIYYRTLESVQHWQQKSIRSMAVKCMRSWKPILTNLRMISKVLGLKLRMRLRQRLEYIQTLISGSKAGFFMCFSSP